MPDLTELSAFFARHYMLCGGWAVVTVMLIAVQVRLLFSNVRRTTPSGATLMVNREEGVFVDVRSLDNYKQGHITNSLSITLSEIRGGRLQRLERSRDKPVIVVGKDRFDTDSFNSARELRKRGFSRVYVLTGGILEWTDANLPLTVK